ncbi:hypothetical protein DSL72_007649 [Monilinia vaccinii-corymbosi]|uniref:Carboxypeptidase n=1 Tax=Monilinia vaccinii-corymbosi TaxID=61207 RepID=A0A8A3PIH7_9HELO|nr:hypothetical protein DSL72_007649 [Monilinia vaccinii-corymbosi]
MYPSISLLLVAATTATAQFVKPPTDLITTKGHLDIPVRYKEVPTGVCELDPNVRSYSGYVDIGQDEHIFWWFFEARNGNASEAPLTAWINGGPGSSAMHGLFQENGPCGIDADGNPVNNPYSWSAVSNMLYIDQPGQVGFSYSIPVHGYIDSSAGLAVSLPDATCPDYAQDCGTYNNGNLSLTVNSTLDGAPKFWRTLQGFMGAFPQYSQNAFNFATESYGGRFGPIYSEYIQSQTAKNIPGAAQISVNSLLIGNGWFDALVQYQAYYNFTVSPGNTYDYSPFTASQEAQLYNNVYGAGNCVDKIEYCVASGINSVCEAADNFCGALVEATYGRYSGRDEYDIRYLTPDPFPYNYYEEYLNTPKVRAAIGAYKNFSSSSRIVYNAFSNTGDDARELGTIAAMKSLLDQGVYVNMWYGDADYNVNWIGGEVISNMIDAPGFSTAGYANITTSDSIVHGQVKQSGHFSFSRIYECGHLIPFYQPLAALEIFERVIGRKDIQTGTIDIDKNKTYVTVGTEKSTYREGNGTVQFEVVPAGATYNTTLNAPNPVSGNGAKELKKARSW